MMIKIMILIVILACVGPFFIKGPNGTPLMTIDDIFEAPAVPESAVNKAPTQVYRYKDENGVWQFTDQPLQDGAPMDGVETMELDGDINLMPAFQEQNTRVAKSESNRLQLPDTPLPTSVNPAELMDAVNNMQDTVDARAAALEKLTDNQ